MNIQLTYDSSALTNAPTGFFAALNYVVSLFDQIFTNQVTINIDVGYGEIDGFPISFNALSESLGEAYFPTYAQTKSALLALNAPGAAKLPATNPSSDSLKITTAEAKALGLINPTSGLDGYIGFSTIAPFSYTANATPAQNYYYFVGAAEHEITEVMGRDSRLNQSGVLSVMDLYRYAGDGVRQLGQGPAYFSIDSGLTDLDNWNGTASIGDLGDWAPSAGDDAFDANGSPGIIDSFSEPDMTVMEALGWTPQELNNPGVLWITRSGNDLIVQVLGTASTSAQIEQDWFNAPWGLNLADGSTISANGLSLIEAADAGYQNATGFNPQASSSLPANATLLAELNVGWSRNLNGSAGSEILDGGFGNDVITGGSADILTYAQSPTSIDANLANGTVSHGTATDTLINVNDVIGSAYDDIFVGGTGSHTINGGGGVNTLNYAGAPGGVAVNLATGTASNGFGGTDSLADIEDVIGAGGNDTFTVGGGDILTGGSGQNHYVLAAAAGADQITNFKLGASGDALMFTGSSPSTVRITDFAFDEDLIVADGSGTTHIAEMQGDNVTANPALSWLDGANWTFQGTGDFTGAGTTDLLARSAATGDTNIMVMSGTNVAQDIVLPWLNGSSWKLQATATFTSSVMTDLVIQNQSSLESYIALMGTGGSVTTLQPLAWLTPAYWALQTTADFNGDGLSDMLIQNQSSKISYVALMSGANVTALDPLPWLDSVHWVYQAAGDFNGDGMADLLVQNVGTGDSYLMLMNNGNVTQEVDLSWLNPRYWTLIGTGDLLGDGKTDLIVRSADGTQTVAYEMTGTNVTAAIPLPWLNGVSWNFEGGGNLFSPVSAVTGSDRATAVLDGVAPALATTANLGNLVAVTGTSTIATGTTGNDLLQASGANDTLVGGGGYDAYLYNSGSGPQTVVNGLSTNSGATGELDFGPNIANTQLWLQQVGNNLVVEVMGTSNSVTVQGWYLSSTSQLQEIKTNAGLMIDSQLNNLVTAMATYASAHPSFNPTSAVNTQIPNDPTLQAAIAAAWHH